MVVYRRNKFAFLFNRNATLGTSHTRKKIARWMRTTLANSSKRFAESLASLSPLAARVASLRWRLRWAPLRRTACSPNSSKRYASRSHTNLLYEVHVTQELDMADELGCSHAHGSTKKPKRLASSIPGALLNNPPTLSNAFASRSYMCPRSVSKNYSLSTSFVVPFQYLSHFRLMTNHHQPFSRRHRFQILFYLNLLACFLSISFAFHVCIQPLSSFNALRSLASLSYVLCPRYPRTIRCKRLFSIYVSIYQTFDRWRDAIFFVSWFICMSVLFAFFISIQPLSSCFSACLLPSNTVYL